VGFVLYSDTCGSYYPHHVLALGIKPEPIVRSPKYPSP
jgi:hypothetical protein